MEISEFAKTILFETSFDAKMLVPDQFTDEHPGSAIAVPNQPGRPSKLQFTQRGKLPAFPSVKALENNRDRGLALHFFANHELMALELMALVLLRLPNAPKGFRLGIAETILEEQNHAQLYKNRSEDFGVEFGDIGLNKAFWDSNKNIGSELEYCSRIGLTLEQANLDYAAYYREEFKKLDDTQTADILNLVYEEEIGHVKHGLKWFRKIRGTTEREFDAFEESLTWPYSPRKAKGIGFDVAGRRASGLSEEFIDRLRVYSKSKGRPGSIYIYNPSECDSVGDCQHLMTFLASEDDTVYSATRPDSLWLKELQSYQIDLPEYLSGASTSVALTRALGQRKVGNYQPWSWNSTAVEMFGGVKELLVERGTSRSPFLKRPEKIVRLNEMILESTWLDDVNQRINAESPWKNASEGPTNRKAVVQEFSVQLDIRHEKPSPYSNSLIYKNLGGCEAPAYLLGKRKYFLSPKVSRFAGKVGMGFQGICRQLAEFLSEPLADKGFVGPAEVKLTMYVSKEGLVQIASIDNAELGFSKGHVASKLEKHIHSDSCGLWLTATRDEITRGISTSMVDFANTLRKKHPPEVIEGKVRAGVVFTNSPDTARSSLGIFLVSSVENISKIHELSNL